LDTTIGTDVPDGVYKNTLDESKPSSGWENTSRKLKRRKRRR
jgi:hypothetical protein